uniref:Aminopeptidase n=1 Tax=Neolamprologus brichardi TaxID=32507 RepID=A0A3Q4GWE0_NEOBR
MSEISPIIFVLILLSYRLSMDVIPEYYNITIWPRLSPDPNNGLYIFTEPKCANVCVCVCMLLLHSWRLYRETVKDVLFFFSPDGAAALIIESTWLQPETQYLVINLKSKLRQGQKYQLYTEFTGELADDLSGFYRSEYEEDGLQKIVATSQMHPTYARKTFPCFDEPALKAIFHITLIHPPGTVALSNDIANITIDGVSWTKTKFEPTKKMSTYLLAITVSDYTYINTTQKDPQIRIWARRKAIDLGQGNYALNVTGPILDFFQSYYNIAYPLTKSDQIALPDFYYGAMENWGLVTYRETNLLYDPKTSSSRNKEKTATIIAHELAHMWFGNLVTLRWWNEVWLNEGFASYVAYLGADHAEPTWNVRDLIVLDKIHKVFAVDALTSSHPLSSNEDSIVLPNQISEQFDVISYSKVQKLQHLTNFGLFSFFLQTYLNHFGYSNTVGNDLWHHLQMAVKDNNGSLPHSVDRIMSPWVLQMGFPVVTINTAIGKVSQKHFLLDADSNVTVKSPYNYEWLIPIRWMRGGTVQKDIWWLMEKEGKAGTQSDGFWVLANINVTGYYRVNYDLGNWERLFTQLNTNHKVIPVINRAQLVDDAFSLARAQLLSTSLALRTTSYLSKETEYMPWQSALNNLDYYYLMLDRTDVYQPMQDYIRKQVTPLFLYFKNMTLDWSINVNICLEKCSSKILTQQCVNCNLFRIHPNLRSVVYCSAIAAGDEAEWEFGWLQFKIASVANEANKLMFALACTNNTELLNRYLSYTLNSTIIRKQDATSVITSVASNRAGQKLAWDFVRNHWEYMFTEYGVGSFSFASMITGVTARFSTPAELQELKEFVEAHSATGFGSATLAVDQALERTRMNIKWLQTNKQEILNWFNSQNGDQMQ